MTTPLFEHIFAAVIGAEGGYTTDPRDPGNWTGGACGVGSCNGTNWGISAAAWPQTDIAALSRDQALALYAAQYWAPIQGEMLPPPLALLVFDAAVNNGRGNAVRWLQAALGCAPDGVLGPQTLNAIGRYPAPLHALCTEVLARRMQYMGGLPGWRLFGLGWARRLCALPFTAISLEQP